MAESIYNEWHWITNEDFVYLNWNTGEPNNASGSQNAIMMYTYHGINNDGYAIEIGKWNDENENGRDWDGYTSQETGFICEWDFTKAENNTGIEKNSSKPAQDTINRKEQSSHYAETLTDDAPSNDATNEELSSEINITLHIGNLSFIGGISIFGGISFIGLIIKKKIRKNNK